MFKQIVIPVDLADKDSIALVSKTALSFAKASSDVSLHFIHVMPDFGMKMVEDYLPRNWIKDQKDKFIKQIQDLVGQYILNNDSTKIYYHITRGAIYDEVIQYANKIQADLIIISAVRPQLKSYMLGPNASKIARHADISVLVVR